MEDFGIKRNKEPRSIEEVLSQAEEDHYLECPNADITTRAAALLLDCILFSLLSSGLHQFYVAADGYMESFEASQSLRFSVHYGIWSLKFAAGYFYFIWSLFQYGGTPAKLLMGLRVLEQETGKHLNQSQAITREILGKAISIGSVFGILLPLVRKDRKAMHDLMCLTVVKKIHGG